ncbi:MAG: AEC family transporter [Prevotella sp.]|nr:AEC family transporter [Alistipes senegalensis]MCM1357613.1 AEC family transporter [Prevotella sp.]
MAQTILNQTVIMLILIIVGVLCAKLKLISSSTNKELSQFVLQMVNPVVIFMSYQKDYEARLVKNLLLTFAFSVIAFAVTILISYLIIWKKEGRHTEVERFSAIYSNCAFMGIPLVNALFGSEGVFYLTAFLTVFNIVIWTHGVITISGEKNFRQVLKVFYSPTIIAILLGIITFFLKIKLPSVPTSALQFIANINTPMAMIVSGVTISSTKIIELLKNARIYYVCLVKLLIIPLVVALAMMPFNIDEMVRMTIVVTAAAPPAAMCTLFCLKYNKNSVYASEIFAAGTILSVISLPIVVNLTEKLTNLFH